MINKSSFYDFWVAGEVYRFTQRVPLESTSDYEQIAIPEQQRETLLQIAAEPQGIFALYSALSNIDGVSSISTTDVYEVIELVRDRMQQYGYSLWRKRPTRFNFQPLDQKPEIPDKPTKPTDKTLDFIEIYLSNPNGEPISHEVYVVKLPNGQERTGTLDIRGFVRIDAIDPGSCQVCFPRLEANSWKAA